MTNPQQPNHPESQLARPTAGLHGAMGGADGASAWSLAIPPSVRRGAGGAGRGGDEDPQPLHKIHNLLRGRYKLAITLATVLAVTLAVAGYLLPKPQYRSDGLIEIKPNMPSLKDATIVMPLYSQYVQSQVAMVGHQRVITSAMESEDWKPYSMGKGLTVEAMKEFVQKLEVEYVPGTFLIRVSFTDHNPDRAQAAVGAIVRSYVQLFGDQDMHELQPRITILNDIIATANRDKTRYSNDLSEKGKIFGTQNLDDLQAARTKEWLELQQQHRQATIQLLSAQAALGEKAAEAGKAADAGDKQATLGELARLDGRVPIYAAQVNEATDKLEAIRVRLGPNHPLVLEQQKQAEAAQRRLDDLTKTLREQYAKTPALGADGRIGVGQAVTEETVAQIKQTVEFLAKQVEASGSLVTHIAQVNNEIQDLRKKIKEADERLADAAKTKESLDVQLAMNGRIQVQSSGDKPVIPAIDRRRQAAILGFLGGGAMPFVFFLLVGLSDKRYRYSDQTKSEMGQVPLLGILPNLPELMTDPQQAAIAAHCVHQIRTLLQVGVRTHDRHVYAITSAAPGDGKTSLTLALGLSFAASGSRTLLIDCDLVGGSLTRRLGVQTSDGMLEAIASRSPMDFVRETDVNDLSILPVGSATMISAASFSPAGLRRLIAEARKQYDIVLIDTGPILGSIEAPPVAATADATILCVSRGQQRPAVERSMHHLIAIGAKMAGIVFNRAEARDFEKSVSRFSQRSIRPGAGDYRQSNSLRLPGSSPAKSDPDGKAAAAAAVSAAAIDPVTRAVQSDFKGDNGNDPR